MRPNHANTCNTNLVTWEQIGLVVGLPGNSLFAFAENAGVIPRCAVLFYIPACDLYVSGTVNQIKQRSLSYNLLTRLVMVCQAAFD